MDILINQEEIKNLAKDFIEKKGHQVKSVDIYIRFKDGISTPRKFHGKVDGPLDLENLKDIRQSDLLQYLDVQIVCAVDV